MFISGKTLNSQRLGCLSPVPIQSMDSGPLTKWHVAGLAASLQTPKSQSIKPPKCHCQDPQNGIVPERKSCLSASDDYIIPMSPVSQRLVLITVNISSQTRVSGQLQHSEDNGRLAWSNPFHKRLLQPKGLLGFSLHITMRESLSPDKMLGWPVGDSSFLLSWKCSRQAANEPHPVLAHRAPLVRSHSWRA